MDFRRELANLVEQIPAGHVARCGDLARTLGDVRASAAVFRYLADHPDIPGGHRAMTDRGRTISPEAVERLKSEGWTPDRAPFAKFRGGGLLTKLRAEQVRLGARVSRRNGFARLRTIAGVDVSYDDGRGVAVLDVLRAQDLSLEVEVLASREVDFPYIPTYLGYREFPLVEAAYRRLSEPPDLLLVDGHGWMHPVRFGLACMVGVKLDVPTIGVAKNPLVGRPDRLPRIGEAVAVRDGREVLGYALRPGKSMKPLYVSTGHRVSPQTAVRIVRELCHAGQPEPLRLAHIRSTDWKRRTKGKSPEEGS